MGKVNIFNLKILIVIYIFVLSIQKINKKKRKKKRIENQPEIIIIPPSSTARKNLTYCPFYTPKDKEFSQISIKYQDGISIIITAYAMEKYIKETLDSIAEQTYFKRYDNWEIIIGVDGCKKTLKYVHSIMENYKNLRVFMMEENKGTYITTNTMMSIAKYDKLLRFDADDIMFSYLVELLINESKFYNYDRIYFKGKNFGNSNIIFWADGQVFMKHWVFDYFGGFMPWICSADSEFIIRVDQFINVEQINIVLFKRRIHNSNLTVKKKTKLGSKFRYQYTKYINQVTRKINNVNDAVIIKIIDNYHEIFYNSTI